MKTRHLLLAVVMLLFTTLTAVAQNATNKKYAEPEIPFGKKLPPPDLNTNFNKPAIIDNASSIPGTYFSQQNTAQKGIGYYRQLFSESKKMMASSINNQARVTMNNLNNSNSDYHLTKDINALAESNPFNASDFYVKPSYAVLNGVAYFAADDGIHGTALWRSDGTAAGTYMVKDLEPGNTQYSISNITAVNGKIYFSAYSDTYPWSIWASDGTEAGTQFLATATGLVSFFAIGKKSYFIADGGDLWSALWETDGTAAGTKQSFDMSAEGIGFAMMQPTIVNDVLFFTLINYQSGGFELWRSDGTLAGSQHLGTSTFFIDFPLQLTNCDNKLYFSSDDGTGRKLWVSDGTDIGTKLVNDNYQVSVDISIVNNIFGLGFQPFTVLNNALYFSGSASNGNGLYKYDASKNEGIVLIKRFVTNGNTASIVPAEMQMVNHTLYFKVTSYTSGVHDELWSSKGTKESTLLIYKLLPEETISNLYNGSGIFYFVKKDKSFGTELWRTYETLFGTLPVIVSDVFKGPTGSYPAYFTAFKGKLIFAAVDEKKGNELFITGGNFFSTALVKDINTTATSSSNAGLNSRNSYYAYNYNGMAALGKDVLFNAYERVHGNELYKSDGTAKGTELLNEIVPGEAGFNIYDIVSKNNNVYFTTASSTDETNYFIYKTNGTKNSLTKVVSDNFSIESLNVADNGLVFYTHYNSAASLYELWRTDGTTAGTFLLSSNIYSKNYLNIIGNTALFVSGDNDHGYELWKSNGTVAGTKLVKDIYPGSDGSYPFGLFLYNNEVYFGAYDGVNHAFWKSDGTKSGTIQLKNIDPWSERNSELTKRFFCVSKNTLYFSAINYSNGKGTELWKTDGTSSGTHVIKDINPLNGDAVPGPYYLTDVNGTVFFAANDGVNGVQLWKTDGTAKGTQLVKNVAHYPYVFSSPAGPMDRLTSFGGKLYFRNEINFKYYLWASDGTEEGTDSVEDAGIVNAEIFAIYANGDNLFLSANTSAYGKELYVGKISNDGKFIASKVASEDAVRTTLSFNAVLYPNPVVSNSTLQITGNTKNVSISITDMNGKKIWQSNNTNAKLVNLPTEKYAAGVYIVTITNGKESKIIKLVKQ